MTNHRSNRFGIFSAVLLMMCCHLAHSAGRTLNQAPGSAISAQAPYAGRPVCTPGHHLNIGGLGGFDSHGAHQSLSCPDGQIVSKITLGTSNTVPALLSSIEIDCANSSFPAQIYPTAKSFTAPIANQTTNFTTLSSSDGFNTASIYTNNDTLVNTSVYPKVSLDPIVQATFGTPDGQTVSGGTPGATIMGPPAIGSSSKQAVFDIPSNARIAGFGLFYGFFINGLTVSLICPDLAGSVPTTAPSTAVQG